MNRQVGWLALTGLFFAGCPVSSDLGTPCNLPRKTDGGVRVLVTEREIQDRATAAGATRDFIGIGAVDCEDSICVRDSSHPKLDAGNLDVPALGYCSTNCVPGSTCKSNNPDDDLRGDRRLNCRPLLLDSETLAAIAADPNAARVLGNVRDPYLCARGSGVTDGGN